MSSMMRIASSGAAFGRHASHTPSVVSAVTEPASRAVVRKSSGGVGRDDDGVDAGRGERNGADEAGRPAADDRDVRREVTRCCRSRLNLSHHRSFARDPRSRD